LIEQRAITTRVVTIGRYSTLDRTACCYYVCGYHITIGRYSLKLVVPTAVPVWVPVPVLSKHAPGPLANGTRYATLIRPTRTSIGASCPFGTPTLL